MIHNALREISCRYCKIYHYLILCKGYMVESHTTHISLRNFSKRCSKDVLILKYFHFIRRISHMWTLIHPLDICSITETIQNLTVIAISQNDIRWTSMG